MKRQGELKYIKKNHQSTLVIAKDLTIFMIIKFLYLNFNKALIIAL